MNASDDLPTYEQAVSKTNQNAPPIYLSVVKLPEATISRSTDNAENEMLPPVPVVRNENTINTTKNKCCEIKKLCRISKCKSRKKKKEIFIVMLVIGVVGAVVGITYVGKVKISIVIII